LTKLISNDYKGEKVNCNIDCNDCKNLSLTENDQIDKRQPHICKHYNKRVFHGASKAIHNPYIFPCKDCEIDNFEKFRIMN